MVSIEAIQKGTANFVDNYLLPQMSSVQEKVVKGSLIALYLNGIPKIIQGATNNPQIANLGIIGEQGIDIELIKNTVSEKINKFGAVTFKAPFIGDITIDAEALQQLYDEIIKVS